MKEIGTSKSAQRLNLRYQERIACLTDMMDTIKKKEEYDLDGIFNTVFDALDEMILNLHGGAIIGYKENKITFFTTRNICTPDDHWETIDSEEKGRILNQLNSDAAKDVLYWNYEANAPIIINTQTHKLAIAISFLCKHADDENLFMIVYRNVLKKPLLSDEIQLIKIVSRILGWHLNYEFTYQLLMYHIEKRFRKAIS